MRSFAVWYEEKKSKQQKRCPDCNQGSEQTNEISEKTPEIEIHINLWEENICKNNQKHVYFDFGFLINEVKSISKVYLYCPFVVNAKTDIKDLGEKISANPNLVNAIFNETYHTRVGVARRLIVIDPKDEKPVDTPIAHEEELMFENNAAGIWNLIREITLDQLNGKGKDKKKKTKAPFIIYNLDVENDFSVENVKNNSKADTKGSIVSFDISKILEGDYGAKGYSKHYFRFRIVTAINNLKLIFQEPKNISPFQDAFVTTQVIDFRLNNLRSCCPNVRDRFAKGAHFNITAAHYLILRNSTDVFIHQGEAVSSRLLEKDLWENYIEDLSDNIIAYHFKKIANEKGFVEDFGILTRFEYQNRKISLILKYIYLLLYMGVFSGIVANLFGSGINADINELISVIISVKGVIFIIATVVFGRIAGSIFKRNRV